MTSHTSPGETGRGATVGVPAERLRALVMFLWPDEITPTAKRMIELLCDEYDHDWCSQDQNP